MILHKKPDLNRQIDNFDNPLKLFARSYHPAPPARVTPLLIRTEPIINNNTGPTIRIDILLGREKHRFS